MELRHARYFLAVANTLNFTAAARALNISQPPLSQQVAALERELGVKLLRRSSRKVELTAAGRAFRLHAEAMMAQAARAASEVRAVGQGSSGSLHVAATSSVIHSGLAARISAYKAKSPDVAIVIHELPPAIQIDWLMARRIDACFARFAPQSSAVDMQLAWREKVGLIVPPGHRLAQRKSVRIAELSEEDFVFYRMPESSFASHLYALCVEDGFAPRVVQEVAEAHSVLSLVAAGLGIGFVPEIFGRQAGVRYLPIAGPAPVADVHSLVLREAAPIAGKFVHFCQVPLAK